MKIFSHDIIKRHSNTIGERNEVDETLALPIFCQDLLGQNIFDPKWTWKSKFFRIVLLFIQSESNLSSTAEAYFFVISLTLFLIKYLFFINCSKDYQETYLRAKTSLLKIIMASSSVKSKKLLKKFKVMVRILFFCLFVLISPLLLIAIWNYPFGRRETFSKSIDTLMPTTSPFYEIGLILHTVVCPSAVFLNFVIDLWFAVLLSFFCTASDSLETMLKIEHDADETELEYKDRLNNTLKTFYEGHATLMQFLSTLCKMFKWLTIIPLVSVLSSFCLTLFSISEELDWQFLCHAVPCLVQILAYNWFGEQMKDKQTKLTMALLEFDWISMRIEEKKNYLIIISYMNKEYRIKTALGIDLSFVTLTSVLKASYQVNTILRTMEI
nr:uncharacterized protein LOC110374343 [Helicoverpa armigera]